MPLRKILIVDDSQLLHKMYDLIFVKLKMSGTGVVHANNGQEAFTQLHQHSDIDIILLDINMPVMSGLEFLQLLRKNAAFDKVKVIIISTEGKEHDINKGLEMGAQAYITKPFQPSEIIALVLKLTSTAPPSPSPGGIPSR